MRMGIRRRMNQKQKFGVRLTAAREAAGMTLEDLGGRLGISAQAVQQWEKGKTEPGITRIGIVAAILNCNVAWLVTGNGDRDQSKNLTLLPQGALGGRLVARVDIVDAVAFVDGDITPNKQHFTVFPCSEMAFQIVLNDDSNSPKYERGDVVVIDPAIKPRPGDMVLAIINTEAIPIFRQYRLVKGDTSPRVVLSPLNAELWDEKEIGSNDELRVLGVGTEHTKPRS
jgi:transcriptional regulator with XRE-family HTH domain